MRFLYFYLMGDDVDRVRDVASHHAAYWHDLGLPEYLGGPFADRSGGLITFEADSAEQADRLIDGDPFVREGLLQRSWTRQWLIG